MKGTFKLHILYHKTNLVHVVNLARLVIKLIKALASQVQNSSQLNTVQAYIHVAQQKKLNHLIKQVRFFCVHTSKSTYIKAFFTGRRLACIARVQEQGTTNKQGTHPHPHSHTDVQSRIKFQVKSVLGIYSL